jgi:hypothetical protein
VMGILWGLVSPIGEMVNGETPRAFTCEAGLKGSGCRGGCMHL